jgi:hypothetical protein
MMPVEGGREGGREDEVEEEEGGFCQWALNEEEEEEGGREGGAKREGRMCSCSRKRRSFKWPNWAFFIPSCLPGTEGRRTACAAEKSTRGRSSWMASTSLGWPTEGGREGGREGGLCKSDGGCNG